MEEPTKISRVLFVRNLPLTTSDAELEEAFSDYGPIRRCFTIKDKGSSTCRGFGYVTFALQEDAVKAKSQSVKIGNRTLHISFSDKREKDRKSSKPDKDEECAEPATKREKLYVAKVSPADKRTVCVNGFSQDSNLEDLKKLCRKYGEVETFDKAENKGVSQVNVRYKNYKDAVKSFQKLHGTVFHGDKISAHLLSQERKILQDIDKSKARIIIRNLPFQCTKDEVMELCSTVGPVDDIQMPTSDENGTPRNRGFCFVTFKSKPLASHAISIINGKDVKGRNIVVDWAVSKEIYVAQLEKKTAFASEGEPKEKHDTELNSKGTDTKAKLMPKDRKYHEVRRKQDKDNQTVPGSFKEEGQKKNKAIEVGDKLGKFDVEIDEREESKAEESEEEESEKNEESDEGGSEGDSEEEEGEESEEEEEKGREEDKRKGEKEDEKASRKGKSGKHTLDDSKEGKTIFVRNLPFESQGEDVLELFEQFGKVEYSKIVFNPETGYSRGSAFVKFSKTEDAERCLKDMEVRSDEHRPLCLEGRELLVVKALPRGEVAPVVEQKSKEKGKEKTDARNLYLASEGILLQDDEEKRKLSPKDKQKREKAWAEKKKKLKDLNTFVSKTRLCARNLPISVDEKKLKETIKRICGLSNQKIKQCKIMRSKERVQEDGRGRSLGFGFVEFFTHEQAMKMLTMFNNKDEPFGAIRRPIVDFAVENKMILNLRKEKMERSKFRVKREEAWTQERKQEKRHVKRETAASTQAKKVDKRLQEKGKSNRKRKDANEVTTDLSSQLVKSRNSGFSIPGKRRKTDSFSATEESLFQSRKEKVQKSFGKAETRQLIKKKHKLISLSSTEVAEEKKFRTMVDSYRTNLFQSGDSKQTNRWFES